MTLTTGLVTTPGFHAGQQTGEPLWIACHPAASVNVLPFLVGVQDEMLGRN